MRKGRIENMNPIIKKIGDNWQIYMIFAIGILIRLIALGQYPCGINQDEAFSGYEAYSLLTTGMDSFGYHNPVYLSAWGSGMNALNTYLILPLMGIFGKALWVVRLPQAIVACVSLYVFYRLLQKTSTQEIAKTGLFVFAICPWHIMMARWGLESNLAPGFLLFSMYAFVLGLDDKKYIIVSFALYGITLYTYATLWVMVPVLILLQAVYGFYIGKLRFDRYLCIGIACLTILALPLILFVFINMGWMDEIKTSVISIPKMIYFRGSDVGLKSIPDRLCKLAKLVITQSDGLIWNETSEFGLYYLFSLPMIVVGAVYLIRQAIISIRKRIFSVEVMTLISLLCAIMLGGIIDVNVNRINCIHIPLISCQVFGVYLIGKYFGKWGKRIIILAYSLSFIAFTCLYFTSYNDQFGRVFHSGIDMAVVQAEQLADDGKNLYVDDGIHYPIIMLCSNENKIEAYQFGYDVRFLDDNGVYVISEQNRQDFLDKGYNIELFDDCAVAYK